MKRAIFIAASVCSLALSAHATPKPPSAGSSMKEQAHQQVKLLGEKEKADMQALNDKLKGVREAASAQIRPLEDQVKAARDKEHSDIATIEEQQRSARAGYETQRDALMEPVEPGYTARRQTLVAQLKTLENKMAMDLTALDAQEKQDIEAVRAKDQGQRKAIREGYAQKRRQAELDARAKK